MRQKEAAILDCRRGRRDARLNKTLSGGDRVEVSVQLHPDLHRNSSSQAVRRIMRAVVALEDRKLK